MAEMNPTQYPFIVCFKFSFMDEGFLELSVKIEELMKSGKKGDIYIYMRKRGMKMNRSVIPKTQRSPGGEHGNLLQHPCLENPMNREAGGLRSIGSQSQTRLK